MIPAAFKLLPCWNGYSGMVTRKFFTWPCTGTNGQANIRARVERHLPIWVGVEVHDERPARDIADASRDVPSYTGEVGLPVIPAHGVQLAALAEIQDLLARSLLGFTPEVTQEVVAINVDLAGSSSASR